MKLFLSYIKTKRRALALCCLFAVILCASFALYRLPMNAVLYPLALCLLLGVIYLCIDFSRVKSIHKQLCGIRDLTGALVQSLPAAESIADADYQAIITMLKGEFAVQETAAEARYQELLDYYTVWVHQIKTPIASMKLSLQSEDTPLARKLSSDLFRIEQYVEMVLAYLRLGSDYTDYVFKETDVDSVLRQSVRKFRSEFIGRKIGLDYEAVNTSFVTDEKWFAFVVEQILSNALKYTREGSIRIYLREPKTLCIADSGIGIAPEDLPRIFQKGYTGCNGRADKSASGLGLYLCRQICDGLGIELCASSVVGEGTEISLNLEQYELKNI